MSRGEVRVRVPAKVNLALCVGPSRADGYHELATIFQAVSLYDEVVAAEADGRVSCQVTGTDAALVGPERRNLAYRAAQLLRKEYGVRAGVRLTIDKRIPIAAGLAGGSADGAGALLACARLWGLAVSADDLLRLAGELGADVPFPLMGGCAVGLGRGETLTPALTRGVFHWVLALSGQGLSTPAVFARFDELWSKDGGDLPHPVVPAELMRALATGDVAGVGARLVNDLQEAACSMAPSLKATLAAGREAGAVGAMVSGSGSAVAFLADGEQAAIDLAVKVSSQGVANQVRLVTGPVPGATVV